jgi:hypothetical protein
MAVDAIHKSVLVVVLRRAEINVPVPIRSNEDASGLVVLVRHLKEKIASRPQHPVYLAKGKVIQADVLENVGGDDVVDGVIGVFQLLQVLLWKFEGSIIDLTSKHLGSAAIRTRLSNHNGFIDRPLGHDQRLAEADIDDRSEESVAAD